MLHTLFHVDIKHHTTEHVTFDNRQIIYKIPDILIAGTLEAYCYAYRAAEILLARNTTTQLENEENEATNRDQLSSLLLSSHAQKKQLLVIMLHGLAGYKSIFNVYADMFRQYNNVNDIKIHMYIPDLHETSKRELKYVMDKLTSDLNFVNEQYPDMAICVFGTSNGARAAVKLRGSILKNNPMWISAIAGPLLGTANFEILPSLLWPFDTLLKEELKLSNPYAHTLLYEARSVNNTVWNFHAARFDTHITPYTSSLPNGFVNATYHVHSDYMHCGVSLYTYKQQIESCISWRNEL